jgi:uncharacterized protein
MTKPFLTARWTNLCLITHAVDPAILHPFLPPGLTLDTRPEFPGQGLVSLVAFDFLDTRLKGFHIPGHINFPEVNLRFYVRDPATGEQGVCFIRELVPKHAIAWVARWIYNDPYRTATMSSEVRSGAAAIRVAHRFRFRNTSATIELSASASARPSAEASLERFLTQRLWGYGTTRSGSRLRYRVDHPLWNLHDNAKASITLDHATIYGQQWGILTTQPPISTILAAGSEVSVMPWSA